MTGILTPMSTIVVVQSDDLSAWIGVAGVAVGVVLTTGIDWWRSRRRERKELRHRLLQAGSDLSAAASAYQKATQAAGEARDEPAWHEVIQTRLEAFRAASLTINLAGNKELDAAALQIVKVAFQPVDFNDPAAIVQNGYELSAVLTAFRDAVRQAEL